MGERYASASSMPDNALVIARVSAHRRRRMRSRRGGTSGTAKPTGRRLLRSRQSLQQVISHADRVGVGGQRRVDRADADEKARIHDVEVVELVRLAVHVKDRGLGIAAKQAGAGLMRTAGDGNVGLHG